MTTRAELQSSIPDWGVDARPEERPGVPREAPPPEPGRFLVRELERQRPTVKVLRRADLPELTPVFGTAQPPRGLSGMLRRLAYRVPDHRARHWFLLMFADRVDVVESAVARGARKRSVRMGVAALAVGLAVRWFVRQRC